MQENEGHANLEESDELRIRPLGHCVDRLGEDQVVFSPADLECLSPLVLAYIGDAVFELWVRLYLVESGYRQMHNLHRQTVDWVNASSQARILEAWTPVLSETERDIVRRGRNTKSSVPRRAKVMDYRLSTGLEALVGYLYLAGEKKRLWELLLLAMKTDAPDHHGHGLGGV